MTWQALSADYAAYHASRGNRICHAIGIPLIILGLVRWTQIEPLTPLPLVAFILPVYFWWNLRLALGMVVMVAVLSGLALWLTPLSALAAFVLGWVFQAVGHAVFEKKRAAFQKNLVHLLVGPAWILQELLGPRRDAGV